mgnify:CR=1 FL=1
MSDHTVAHAVFRFTHPDTKLRGFAASFLYFVSNNCFNNSLDDETLLSLSNYLSNFLNFFENELIEGKIEV